MVTKMGPLTLKCFVVLMLMKPSVLLSPSSLDQSLQAKIITRTKSLSFVENATYASDIEVWRNNAAAKLNLARKPISRPGLLNIKSTILKSKSVFTAEHKDFSPAQGLISSASHINRNFSDTPSSTTVNHVALGSARSRSIRSLFEHIRGDNYLFGLGSKVNVWDKAAFTAEEYHKNVCDYRCNGTERVNMGSFPCANIACFPCRCDRPKCEAYGLCCPELEEEEEITEASAKKDRDNEDMKDLDVGTSSQKPIIRIDLSLGGSYLYIQSCPPTFDHNEIKKKCEDVYDTVRGTGISEDVFTTVTDPLTGAFYHNKYCAQCNGVIESVPWQLEVQCAYYTEVYRATTTDQLLTEALRPDNGCEVWQKVQPHDPKILSIDKEWLRDPIRTCNTTKLWRTYDAQVKDACINMLEDRDHYVRQLDVRNEVTGYPYKNVFCAICNSADYPVSRPCGPIDDTGYNPPPDVDLPFTMLLGFGRQSSSRPQYKSSFTFSQCGELEWPSPDGSCLQLTCPPGKILQEGNCSTALEEIRGLGYRIGVWFEKSVRRKDITDLGHVVPQANVLQQRFMEQVKTILNPIVEVFKVNIGASLRFVCKGCENTDTLTEIADDTFVVTFWIEGHLVARMNMPRDEFESDMTRNLINPEFVLNVDKFQLNMSTSLAWSDLDVLGFCLRDDNECAAYDLTESKSKDGVTIMSRYNSFFRFTGNLFCVSVQFNRDRYEIETTENTYNFPHIKVTLWLSDAIITFSQPEELHQLSVVDKEETLSICKDILDIKLQDVEEARKKKFYSDYFRSQADDITAAQYYMTLACMGASLLCLLLTILTYFLFSVLRSSAGVHNVFLCTSLLFAQACLLASAHVSGPRTVCTSLGVITHFLWLWVFAWSFICCYRMFRVFTAKTRHSATSRSQASEILGSLVPSLLVPLLIICIVVVSSNVTSGGSKIGYGDESCYLNTPLLIGLATALPLSLVTVSNLTFFAITVTKISEIKKLQSTHFQRNEDRKNFTIYVKLSTMTGIFWSVQLLAEAIDVDLLRFVAIVLNGLQGVFIFVSYICNKRVLNLYLSRMGLEPMTLSSKSSNPNRTYRIPSETPAQNTNKAPNSCQEISDSHQNGGSYLFNDEISLNDQKTDNGSSAKPGNVYIIDNFELSKDDGSNTYECIQSETSKSENSKSQDEGCNLSQRSYTDKHLENEYASIED